MTRLRCGFVTCVQLGLDVMDEIYQVGGELSLAVTLSDDLATKKSGRVFLDAFCASRGITLVKSSSVNDDLVIQSIRKMQIDWLFIVGWSQIASQRALQAPNLGCIGMHPTLLPEGRGRASIPWAILKGLAETGVTMFQLDEGVDTGPILAQHRISMRGDMNATELYQRVVEAHRFLIRDNWQDLADGSLNPEPQLVTEGSYWPARTPEDGELAPSLTVVEALRLVRATTHPYPGAFWKQRGQLVRVWDAQELTDGPSRRPTFRCRDGSIEAVSYDAEPAVDI